jgi:hypothetical protein
MNVLRTVKSPYIFLLLLSVLLIGCAPLTGELVGKLPIVVGDNYATINICRPTPTPKGYRMGIKLDHNYFYQLAQGELLVFRVPATIPIDR